MQPYTGFTVFIILRKLMILARFCDCRTLKQVLDTQLGWVATQSILWKLLTRKSDKGVHKL